MRNRIGVAERNKFYLISKQEIYDFIINKARVCMYFSVRMNNNILNFPAEIITIVIKELRNDKFSLHSLLLVNKKLSSFTVPFLWEQALYWPLSNSQKLYNIMPIIYRCLSTEFSGPMNNCNFQPLYSYFSFCRQVNIDKIIKFDFLEKDIPITKVIIKIFESYNIKKIKMTSNKNLEFLFKCNWLQSINATFSTDHESNSSLIKIINKQQFLNSLKLEVMSEIWEELLPLFSEITTLKKLKLKGLLPKNYSFIQKFSNVEILEIDNFYLNFKDEINFDTLTSLDMMHLKILRIRSGMLDFKNKNLGLKSLLKKHGFKLKELSTLQDTYDTYLDFIEYCRIIKYLTIYIYNYKTLQSLENILDYKEIDRVEFFNYKMNILENRDHNLNSNLKLVKFKSDDLNEDDHFLNNFKKFSNFKFNIRIS
ncbi:hypothetical protein GLOIN_2v1777676 [Rhizophagus clarus]|uniref:Uncharacterized protein n=1 Tax=Rhizophagus clarus TaxID=94130 RepID=A0A8H3R4S3_9GLOM|nr:hypothetical protein GLOIN_2v1777676 [Rhizophagus clarus]